jgi:predicted Holliday junction resolvase-like endonuclease
MSPFLIPLAVFAMVVLIVALVNVAKIQSLETEVHQKLHAQEMEHQRKMKELDLELQRINQGN